MYNMFALKLLISICFDSIIESPMQILFSQTMSKRKLKIILFLKYPKTNYFKIGNN